jgi:hypothetical protein
MSPGALSRDAVVDALDDLGEREHIAPAWLDEDDETPYPPKAVHERSKRLRERLRWWRGTAFFHTAGWGHRRTRHCGMDDSRCPVWFLAGFGGGFVGASFFADPWTEDQVRALQLYDLLTHVDDQSEPAE